MKFLFLSGGAHLVWDPSAPRAAGGAELQVALMARELVRRGHEAVLLGADTGQQDGAVWEGIRIRKAGRYDTGGATDTMLAWPKIHRVLREERPDYVIVFGWTALLYALAWWRWVVPFKLVFVCALDAEIDGELRRQRPVSGGLFHRGMMKADVRLAISEYEAELFRREGMSCDVMRLLLREREFAGIADKPLDLLWVARCQDVKRPHVFLDLAEKLPEARCRMICTPHDRALFERVRERAERMPNVEFVEGVAYRDIQGHFNAAKIFVNTSSHEGVPNTFIHAGLGRTAIASLEINPDGMFENFSAGVLGGGDFEALTAGVRELLDDPERLAVASGESVRFVCAWHDNDQNIAVFLRAAGVQ